MGWISWPEPQKNASSAAYTSVRSMSRSVVGVGAKSCSRSITVARVTLSRMELVTPGVTGRPPRTMKKHDPGDSATCPACVRSSTLS